MNKTLPPQSLTVELGSRSYTILIGANLLHQLGSHLKPLLPGKQVAIISNQTVAPLYLSTVKNSLQQHGFQTLEIILPDGESFKDWVHLQKIFDGLLEQCFERSATLLALGGGVVGDMTGFAAATFLRGVPFVQIPTTLLSQVDASVGGKTGINHPLGKNLIGAFHQPQLVMIDVETLKTLPIKERVAGLAEVLKYGIIWDKEFFQTLEQNIENLLNLDQAFLTQVITTCCAIKADIVSKDEREAGTRALLNLGHTFGHAIESLAGYGTILHGEGVAIGTVMAADLSHMLGLCSFEDSERIRHLIEAYGLPTTAPHFPVEQYLTAMTRDKKVEHGELRLVLVDKIGQASIHKGVPIEFIRKAIIGRMKPQ